MFHPSLDSWNRPLRHWRLELRPGESIREVIIYAGFIVDGIGFVVEHQDGTTSTRLFSGRGGTPHKISIDRNEYITHISGEHGLFQYSNRRQIALIRIHTNLRPAGYGPFGRSECATNIRRFSTQQLGSAVVGLFGAGDQYLDCIGLITTKVDDHGYEVDPQSMSISLFNGPKKPNEGSTSEKGEFYRKGDDRISELPDDIIHKFLSLLNIKEAAQTSILSKRWRHLWTYGSNLEFEPALLDPERCVFNLCSEMYKLKYINWVNHVARLHRGECIDKFKVEIALDGPNQIDNWVKFAISKRVKELDLSLYSSAHYALRVDFLRRSSFDGSNQFLTSVRLVNIQVTRESLDLLLSQSHNLERLYVHGSHELSSLKVSSDSLKHLTINHCGKLEQLEIDAANLVYFEYLDKSPCHEPNVLFMSAQALGEVNFGGRSCHFPIPIFQKIAILSTQLKAVSLDLEEVTGMDGFATIMLPCFSNVTHLKITIQTKPNNCLLFLSSLIQACPILLDFRIQISWLYKIGNVPGTYVPEDNRLMRLDMDSKLKNEPEHRNIMQDERSDQMKMYTNLKAMEVDGFVGCTGDVELILHIVHSAPALERIVCDRRTWPAFENFDLYTYNELESSRTRAAKIARLVPPRVNVVVT